MQEDHLGQCQESNSTLFQILLYKHCIPLLQGSKHDRLEHSAHALQTLLLISPPRCHTTNLLGAALEGHELNTALMSARACSSAALASSVSFCVAAISRSTGACCRQSDCTKMDSRKGTLTLLASMPCKSPLCSAYRIATCEHSMNVVMYSTFL